MTEVLALLCLFVSLFAYLDNLLLFCGFPRIVDSRSGIDEGLSGRPIGLQLNLDMSNLVPSQHVTYLGYLWDSIQQKVFLPQEKVQKIDSTMRLLQGRSW